MQCCEQNHYFTSNIDLFQGRWTRELYLNGQAKANSKCHPERPDDNSWKYNHNHQNFSLFCTTEQWFCSIFRDITGSATQINTQSVANFSHTIPPNWMGKSSFSSLKYWEQLYLLPFLSKLSFSCPNERKCRVVRFSVARTSCFSLSGRCKKCKNRRSKKKWGSRFASYLNNETRY